jgi:DMSO/TMAO reductase YedYZ molybdopterin-dependent catalytic subunit
VPDFYRIDTELAVPEIDPDRWSLRIHGMVQREIRLSYPQLLRRPLVERWITLCCVSNPVGGRLVGNTRWLGTLLAPLLREAGVRASADQLLMTSVDGFTIGTPMAAVLDGRDAMVAVGMAGEPLPVEHGFPARVVIPGLYGYVSACKWVTDLEATTFATRTAFWIEQGWAQTTRVQLESRIDVPRQQATVRVGRPVPVAGVAWDQHVGVGRVEVQVDGGAWRRAELGTEVSIDTWRQWYLPWTPAQAGRHVLRVRAFDRSGRRQDGTARDPFPAGATGLHTITVEAR